MAASSIHPARADAAPDNQFVAVSPAVLADTRNGTGGVGSAKVPGKGQVTFQVAGQAEIPASGVSAVVLNITAIGAEQAGWFTVHPSDAPTTVSTLTFYPGENVTGEDFTRLTSTGMVSVVNNSDSPVHIVVAVRGYFLSAADIQAGNEYYPVGAEYVYDTRPGHVTGSPVHDATAIPADSSVTIDVAGQGSVPAAGATAVALNVVAWSQGQQGWLSLHPSDQPGNNVATVDYVPDETNSSFTVAQLTPSGKLILDNRGSGTVHVALTLRGFFEATAEEDGAGYVTVPSKVIVETITGAGVPDGSTQALAPGTSVTFDVTQGIDLGDKTVASAALTIQARRPTDKGWLTVYPAEDGDSDISSVNYDQAESTTGFDLVIPDSQGHVTITNRGPGTTHIQVSLRGYFIDPPMPVEYDNPPELPITETIPEEDEAATVGAPGRKFNAKARLGFDRLTLPGLFEGKVWWHGRAPYEIYINAEVSDNRKDGRCIGALVRMDGKVYSNWKYWVACGSQKPPRKLKGWFPRTANRIDFKACQVNPKTRRYAWCTTEWK
ncbi:hypothetical protein GCM10022419_114830 [Nonomuraea rosea]|uniref:BACON domain-containing protein n=2 Tax=Nonomuraea rosea TaxID=638574 RepID=A0ABP6ZJE8_9ACTN